MKRIYSILLLLIAGAFNFAQSQNTRVASDCSQGLLLNKSSDNWFLTLQGGSNFMISANDGAAFFYDRLGANAGLFVGKWFSPVAGIRFGGNYLYGRGATNIDGKYYDSDQKKYHDGKYREVLMGIGPEIDMLFNLTNWWCGYRPGRIYDATFHIGAGAYATMHHRGKNGKIRWRFEGTNPLMANVGLQNNFHVSRKIDLFLDLKYELISFSSYTSDIAVQLGLTVNLGKSKWNCPKVKRCEESIYTNEEGNALVRRLEHADYIIADLRSKLENVSGEKVDATPMINPALLTVYYPIGEFTLSKREKNMLRAVAEIMIENPDKKYELTGWADNYTGTEAINNPLRHERVTGVRDFLVGCGVSPSRLMVKVNGSNLTQLGEAGAALDRAVTITMRSE